MELSREQWEKTICRLAYHSNDDVEILRAHDAAQRTRLEAVEEKLKIYLEWDNNGDECFVPGHADLQQQLATATGKLERLQTFVDSSQLQKDYDTAQARIKELESAC